MVEAGNEKLWLWQGWWPDVGHEANDTNMTTGSGIIRWHAERREAMRTIKEFQRSKFSKLTSQTRPPMELVWAGHEPLEFTNLFPSWTHHIDVETLNYNVSNGPIRLSLAELQDLQETIHGKCYKVDSRQNKFSSMKIACPF